MLRYCSFLLHLHTRTSCYKGAHKSWIGLGCGWKKSCHMPWKTEMTKSLIPVCGNTYTSSSTDITRKTRNPSCSGWKTSFAYFCSRGLEWWYTQNTVNIRSNAQFWSILPEYWGGLLPCTWPLFYFTMLPDRANNDVSQDSVWNIWRKFWKWQKPLPEIFYLLGKEFRMKPMHNYKHV